MPVQPAFFESHAIRRVYDEESEIWWFSVVDIVQVLTQQADYQTARKYWNKLKERLGKEGSQLVTDCHQLKMTAEDGKQRLSDEATGMAENSISDAVADLGKPEEIGKVFSGFQKYLYVEAM